MTDSFANFIKILGSNGGEAYDFLRSNWWRMDADELADIASEALYAIYSCTIAADEQRCYRQMHTELLDSHIDDIDLPV